MLDISLPTHSFFSIGPMPVTDAMLGSVLVSLVILGVFLVGARRFSIIPTRWQLFLEMIAEYIMNQLENAFHSKKRAQTFFPFFMTMLVLLVVANEFALMPLVFEIVYEHADLIRQPTSDFSLPIAFGLLVVGISHWMALKIAPMRHVQNFIAIKPVFMARSFMELFTALVGVFVGILNIVGEFAKVISISARLFGNIFAGNVMVAVILSLSIYTQFIVPIPFLILGVFSGLVQSFVFMLLSIQFIALSIDGVSDPIESGAPESSPVSVR